MSAIIIFASILFFHQVYLTLKNRRLYRSAGQKLSAFNQKSFIRKVLLVILLLVISFTAWSFNNFGNLALANIPMICYAGLMLYNHSIKIELLEDGVFLNGKFFDWQGIDKVEVDSNNSLRLSLHGGSYKVFVADNVVNVRDLEKLIKQHMKKARKNA
jgi:hypothetical protein